MLRHARTALANDWIVPFYQPQIELSTGAIAGFEALLRWQHPRAGIQNPASIAHAFDEPSTAGLLGAVMAEAVLADLKNWTANDQPIQKLAINVSAAEFLEPAYAEKMLARLAMLNVPPAMLEVEVTETAFLEDGARSVTAALATLRAAGMKVALDDFGTVFSSLSHHRDLPVNTIKIDRSFVRRLDTSSRDRAIIKAVLMLGSALGVATVAEGVETQLQAALLNDHGCTSAQGHLFSPAIPATGVDHYLAQR